jgi:hypothetical protein
MEFQCSFDLHFLYSQGVRHFFMYLLAIYISSFENCLFNSLAHLLIGLFVLLVFNFWTLYILDINSLSGE